MVRCLGGCGRQEEGGIEGGREGGAGVGGGDV